MASKTWTKVIAGVGGAGLLAMFGMTVLGGCSTARTAPAGPGGYERASAPMEATAMASGESAYGEGAPEGGAATGSPTSDVGSTSTGVAMKSAVVRGPASVAPSTLPAMEPPSPAARPMRRPAPQYEHGQLTAGDWDDNLNFPFFLSYMDRFLSARQGYPHLNVSNRAVITVRNAAGQPVGGARVTVSGGDRRLFTSTTAADGRVLFVPGLDGAPSGASFSLNVEPPPGQAGLAPVTVAAPAQGQDWRVELPVAEPRRPQALDLAFVVDTTGSMGDELEYLKAEIQGISDSVKRVYGDIDIRYGLVLYRDEGDEYVTRKQDFTDLGTFRATLNAQSADGGGDTPEAAEEGLRVMNELSWRSGNVARVAFFVADAPPHRQNASRFLEQADQARKRGVRVYSLAASGIDDEAEFVMRQASELTLARYLFLTDDSGIGNSHAEPHIPCYQVQRLSNLVARMIRSELTGAREEATEVIRSVGNPKNGTCMKDNKVAYHY